MTITSQTPLHFKFHYLNQEGQQTGIIRKKGSFDGETLQIDDAVIPAAGIIEIMPFENRLFFTVFAEEGATGFGIILPGAKLASKLKLAIDQVRSQGWAAAHRERLARAGESDRYRVEACPVCEASVVLSHMPRTPQVYCPFCQSLSYLQNDEVPQGKVSRFRTCGDCGYFSYPRKFTIFYFYFLVFLYGWRTRVVHRCANCMKGDAWKMLALNAPFVLGTPVALTQLARTYSSDLRNAPYNGLDSANKAAVSGHLTRALKKYRDILDRVGAAAGIKHNLGLALLASGDERRAQEFFRLALDDCANYVPSYEKLKTLLEESGNAEELEELRRQWEEPAILEEESQA